MISAREIRALWSYEPDSGRFYWRVSTGRVKRGAVVGSTRPDGYIYARARGFSGGLHRFCWLYHFGYWPLAEIDHINGNKSDNRIDNLRLATRTQNEANKGTRRDNTSGRKGVSWHKRRSAWAANISINGTSKFIGYFGTVEQAHAAYVSAGKKHFGEFFRCS